MIMLGKKEFIKLEEGKHEEIAATSKLEGTKTTEVKSDMILRENEIEKVKDELIVGMQDWLEKHVEGMIKNVFCSLFSKRTISIQGLVNLRLISLMLVLSC